jgi:cytochrome c peroxidase
MRAALLAIAAAGLGCGGGSPDVPDGSTPPDATVDPDARPTGWPFALPVGFPTPRLPDGRVLTPELAELGRHLFYDVRLSGNGTQACASCHAQDKAFTDGRDTPTGSTGTVLKRNSMSLTNIAYNPTQTWATPLLVHLEQQAPVPMFSDDPVELGITGNEDVVLGRLRADPRYDQLHAAAFPEAIGPIELADVILAISAFERRLISGDSDVDKYRRGDIQLTASELRGEALFFSERLECHHCHGGFNFTAAVDFEGLAEPGIAFFNTGLYNVGGTGAYPTIDQGLYDVSLQDVDRGRFRPPTLRNIAVTAPYMHDGTLATLTDVIASYERGGRLITSGPNAGDGHDNPYKSAFVAGFVITDQERTDLIAFLTALTDHTFLTDPTLSDPFAN